MKTKFLMRRIFFAVLLCSNVVSAQVTIENLLSVPFPTQLKSSENGKHIAWVFNNQGVRNLYSADAPDFTTRRLTNNTSDNGIEISSVRFTPDGNNILFTEGNPNNNKGEPANPALLQTKTERVIWIVNTTGKNLRKIGTGDNAIVSPDNKTIAFLSNGQIWWTLLDSSKTSEKLLQTRGTLENIRWSPDGKKLAFISNRSDHAFVGIYDLINKTISYPDPSVDKDGSAVWSPDGKSIVYIRTPNNKDRLPFTDKREGSPWSIRLLNIENGTSKEIWKASAGMGSVFTFEIPVTENLLLWGADDNLIFPSEKDGWVHLYSLNIKNGNTHLLTPGSGEVENVVLSADKKEIIYTTNINDSHRRHIWKVNINGGDPVQLSKGNGIEWSPVITQNEIAILHSSATAPGWPYILKADGSLKKLSPELFPTSFPENSLVIPSDVTFRAKDGMLIHGQLFLPPGYQSNKKYPALLFFHGGSRRQMLLGFHYMDYYSHDYAMNQYNAINGYIVLSVNYRSGIGYGLNFREAMHYGANGGSEYNDVIGAGMYIKSRADVDTKRIGLWGGSYGGYLTAMGLAINSDVFACGVDIHGVHDWSDELKNWVTDYDPATRAAFAKIAFASSPVNFIKGWRSPVLFIHGDDDRNVPFNQTVNLIEKLRERNVYFEQLIFPDEVHSFLLHKNWLKAYHTSEDFFKRKLKNK
ncbi:MAG: prolyl oligopeptidase family serine peptidase [Thermoproteota archaeon]|nr:prolyl oligopeptidase family serine peptidase [Thermoproteota archaeon]